MSNWLGAGFPTSQPHISLGRSMRSPRSLGAVLLLALALVLVAVLAYQAQDAARSHRRMAESTLHDYAAFADGRLSEQAKNSLMMKIMSSFAYAASRVNPGRL